MEGRGWAGSQAQAGLGSPVSTGSREVKKWRKGWCLLKAGKQMQQLTGSQPQAGLVGPASPGSWEVEERRALQHSLEVGRKTGEQESRKAAASMLVASRHQEG